MFGKKHSGFTLIEILIAMAILGIIVSIAVPSYGNYVKRSKVAEAIVISEEARIALIADHVKRRQFVESYSDWDRRNAEIGLPPTESYKSDTIVEMWVGSTGVKGADTTSAHIAIRFDPKLGVSTSSRPGFMLSTVEYKDGEYIYTCANTESIWRSNIKEEYLPASCKN